MPRDARGRAEVIEWLFAALNSVEMAIVPWSLFAFNHGKADAPGRKRFDEFLEGRLKRLEPCSASANGSPDPSPSPTS